MKKFLKGFLTGIAVALGAGAVCVAMVGLMGGMGFLLWWVVLMVVLFVGIRRRSKESKRDKAILAEKTAKGVIPAATRSARHVAGLPIPPGVPCHVEVYSDRLYIDGGSRTFELPMSRVVGAQLYEDTEMRHYVESSLFQTMLGGAAFGATGAIIGAIPESKYRREIAKYNLLLNYTAEDGSPKAVVFTDDTSLWGLGLSIQEYHKGSKPKEVTKL